MALFGSASRTVKLYLTGDSTGLERALKRSETKLKGFERTAGRGSTFNSGLLGGFTKGGAITAGAGLAALGIKSALDAAKNAEVILGQTSVAVEDAGLSWEKYGKQVQDASLRISNSSAFDDEAVLQSFQVFVRGQKDVGKSLKLSELAADVARGRYTDLASATQLVNKAALGQIGALRRAGIAIDKNATSTEALAALQRAYGGAAVRYANTAAGAQDKLRVSVENLRESIGGGLLPVVTSLVNNTTELVTATQNLGDGLKRVDKESGGFLGDAAKNIAHVALLMNPGGQILAGAKLINDAFDNTKKQLQDINDLASAFAQTVGGINLNPGGARTPQNPGGTSGSGRRPAFGEPGFKPGTAPAVPPGVSASLRNRIFDQRIAREIDRVQDITSLPGQIAALQKIKAEIAARIKITKDPTRRLNLGDQIVDINRQILGLNDEIKQNLKDKAQALKDAKEEAARLRKEQADQLRQQAKDFKSAALDALSRREDRVNAARQLVDAREQLREALRFGGRHGIQEARRNIQDALLEQERQRIQDSQVRATGKGTFSVDIGAVHLHGVQNVKQLLAELQKASKKGGSQQRGRNPGTNPIGL